MRLIKMLLLSTNASEKNKYFAIKFSNYKVNLRKIINKI